MSQADDAGRHTSAIRGRLRYELVPAVEFVDGGRALLGGDPVRLIRLSAAGGRLVRSWAGDGVVVDASTAPAERSLIERLDAAGMIHPRVEAPSPGRPTVIVPTYGRPEPLDRCLAALVRSGVSDIVVVDDASPNGGDIREVAERHGARSLRRTDNGGPAAARMTGWRQLLTESATDAVPALVAFVDSDIEVDPDWLAPVVGLFADDRVGVVAPRVLHRSAGASALDRYEAANSPLDLGERPARIVAGTRVSYVPAAALVVRAAAFADVGGFDESLVVGEDVDLLWRLADAGWIGRYEPASVVAHHGRSRLREVLERRGDYGGSAALLDERHGGALPPLRANAWSVAIIAAVVARKPVVAAALWAWTARSMAARLDALDDAEAVALRLTARGHLGAFRQAGRASVRPWFPITTVAALASRRLRWPAAVGVLIEPLLQWRRRRPGLDPFRWTVLFLADDLAYSVGVWRGCVSARSMRALAPSISRASR